MVVERDRLMDHGWKELIAKLQLNSFREWDTSMQSLRLLANCYKHEPSEGPGFELLKHRKLSELNYASLSESDAIREGLAESVGLAAHADYCEIAERFLECVERFLTEVREQPGLSPIKSGAVSINPADAAH